MALKIWFVIASLALLVSCAHEPTPSVLVFETIDTDFSKGRLTHKQRHTLNDLEKFHGHLCDGLVVGALALQQAIRVLAPNQPINRTNLRIVSKPSPCLTDVAIYLTGGRYQFNTFYVANDFEGLYIVQRIDDQRAVSVFLNDGVKPPIIDSLGSLAIAGHLPPCDIDRLKKLEDDFSAVLLHADPSAVFTVIELADFQWAPKLRNDLRKTDVINKYAPTCN